jgi:UDP-2,3-diacylglucosamine pyrophosphatase LpxH
MTRQPQKIIFISDCHVNKESYLDSSCTVYYAAREVTKRINSEKFNTLIYGGDFGEGSHGKEGEVIEAMQEFNALIDPKIRRVFLRGNHDYGILQKAFPRHKIHNYFLHRRTLFIHGDDFDIFGEIPYFFAKVFGDKMTPEYYYKTKAFILNLLSRDLRENDVLRPRFNRVAKAWNKNDKDGINKIADAVIEYFMCRVKGHRIKKAIAKPVLKKFVLSQLMDMMQKQGRDNKAFPDPARVERFLKLHGLIDVVDTIVTGHSHEWHDRIITIKKEVLFVHPTVIPTAPRACWYETEEKQIRDINAGTCGFANKPRTIYIDDGVTKGVVEI